MSLKKINGYTINLNKQLGRGAFGVVYAAEQEGTKVQCAVKMLDKMLIDADQMIRSAIMRQIQILKHLRCQHIVGFFDVMQSSRYYYIVQEICDSDLEKHLRSKQNITEDEAIEFLHQTCDGFLCLIKEGIVHRDLKPANIMLKNKKVKLGDFGLAKRCRNKRIKIDSSVGSPLYMSLQLLKQQPYSSKCDIWAVGCVFYQLLHGKTPWFARTQYALVQQIQKQDLIIAEDLRQQTKDFIKKCLQKQEADRISWDQLFLHPIFKGKFVKYAMRNKEFENKLKMIMSDMRFKINAENIDMRKLFDRLGFSDKKQLVFRNFDQFIRIVNPAITSEQVVYFFEKLDKNDDGKISIKQLEEEMQNNHISLQGSDRYLDIYREIHTQQSDTYSFCSQQQAKKSRLDQELQFKIRKCFVKLYKILNDKKLTIYKTFRTYDQDKTGALQLKDFSKIVKKLDASISQKNLEVLFNFIDKDNSGAIQFDEFNAYYCRVNGVPEVVDLPPQFYYAKGKIDFKRNQDQKERLCHFFKNTKVKNY